jgi:transposase
VRPAPHNQTWPPIRDGAVHLTATQLAMLLDGLDWTRVASKAVKQPLRAV